jgi:hypothetical protein
LSRIVTPFGFHSTAAEVMAAVDLTVSLELIA